MNKNLWLNDVVYTYQWLYSSFNPSRTIPQKQFQGSVRSTNASDFLTNPFGFIVRGLQHRLRLIHGAVSKPAGTARGVGLVEKPAKGQPVEMLGTFLEKII